MPELVTDCPRCGAQQITFDLTEDNFLGTEHGWQPWYEAFCICRRCKQATVFVLSLNHNAYSDAGTVQSKGLLGLKGAVNRYMDVERYITLKDTANVHPPEHLPADVEAAFKEGAACFSIGCWNAAGTMFRLCIDIATRAKLPEGEVQGLNAKTRRDLGLRLPWLFDNHYLPEELRELSSCIKEDGNDGAHVGNLKKDDAEDLLDFTETLLERIYTEPERLRLAKDRRDSRRSQKT